jgi:hypothetical protein
MIRQVKYTAQQTEIIRDRYPHELTSIIADDIGRSVKSVHYKAHKMGLKKTAEFLSSAAAGRTTGGTGWGTRFAKGNVAWNKGAKGLQLGGEAGWFKKGSTPTNRQPVGSTRISKDGYLEIKAAEGMRQWRAWHRLEWEKYFGLIPKGHVVVFKDGNYEHRHIDNLECITRIELMKRNTVHNLPKELALIVQLKGALQRQINAKQSDV